MSHPGKDKKPPPPLILYAEANGLLRRVVEDVLGLAGYRVRDCRNGIYALAHLSHTEHFDLVLLENDLPSMRGLDVVRRARGLKHREHTPFIVTGLEDLAEEAQRAGADAFLQKPNDLLALVETVGRLLKRRQK